MLINKPPQPGSESNKPSLYETQGDSIISIPIWAKTFDKACAQHDFGYCNFGRDGGLGLDSSSRMKERIDSHFRNLMLDACPGKRGGLIGVQCRATAEQYYFAVKKFGGKDSFG